tara:strand:- start:16002 stop:16493 length:492 start_codon:yes stop_codon:yes gene_type:complete
MCTPEAQVALAIGGKVMEYQGQKAKAKQQEAINAANRGRATRGYLTDVTAINQNQQAKAEDKVRADLKLRKERRAAVAKMLNLGAGNTNAILRDINTDANVDFNQNQAGFESDLASLDRKRMEAYGAMESVWYSQPIPQRPSLMGLAIDSASAGVDYKVATTT